MTDQECTIKPSSSSDETSGNVSENEPGLNNQVERDRSSYLEALTYKVEPSSDDDDSAFEFSGLRPRVKFEYPAISGWAVGYPTLSGDLRGRHFQAYRVILVHDEPKTAVTKPDVTKTAVTKPVKLSSSRALPPEKNTTSRDLPIVSSNPDALTRYWYDSE